MSGHRVYTSWQSGRVVLGAGLMQKYFEVRGFKSHRCRFFRFLLCALNKVDKHRKIVFYSSAFNLNLRHLFKTVHLGLTIFTRAAARRYAYSACATLRQHRVRPSVRLLQAVFCLAERKQDRAPPDSSMISLFDKVRLVENSEGSPPRNVPNDSVVGFR